MRSLRRLLSNWQVRTHRSLIASGALVPLCPHLRLSSVSCSVLLAWLALLCSSDAFGQSPTTKKKAEKTEKAVKSATKAAAKAAKSGAPQTPVNVLEELDFGAAQKSLLEASGVEEPDETSDGKQRLKGLQSRAKEIFEERGVLDGKRQPIVARRDVLVDEVAQMTQTNAVTQEAILQTQAEVRRLQGLVNNNINVQNSRNEILNLENQIRMGNISITVNQRAISTRVSDINEYNIELVPLDEQLRKLWTDLNTSRRQWLEICVPHQKYGHGNFEGLKRAIEDWLLFDGLWPEAYCWAALCNYELADYELAWSQVDLTAELRTKLQFSTAWAQGEAMRGMIAYKVPTRRSKADNHLQLATLYANRDKKTNWMVFFMMGRATCENDKGAGKSKMNFEKALKINADAICVKYWYAQLQTSTSTAAIRDVETGTKTLEELWKQSTKKSWRLAYALVLAYDSGKRDADANATWDLVQSLAPKTEIDNLKQGREDAKEKEKNAAATEATVKPKKAETKKKASE
jgi:hypothetical protein